MAFVGEFLTSLVKRSMEDPVARREARDKHLAAVAAKSEELKAAWAQSTKAPGFWRTEEGNATYTFNLSPSLARMPGRRDPYENR